MSVRLPTPDETTTFISMPRVSTESAGRVVKAALLMLPSDRADALAGSEGVGFCIQPV